MMRVKPVEGDHDSLGNRERPARQTRAAATGNEWNVVFVTETDGADNLVGRFRDHDGPGTDGESRQGVGFIGDDVRRPHENPIWRVVNGSQFPEQLLSLHRIPVDLSTPKATLSFSDHGQPK